MTNVSILSYWPANLKDLNECTLINMTCHTCGNLVWFNPATLPPTHTTPQPVITQPERPINEMDNTCLNTTGPRTQRTRGIHTDCALHRPFFPGLHEGSCPTCQNYPVPWPALKENKQSQPAPLGHGWVMSTLAQCSDTTQGANNHTEQKEGTAQTVRDRDRPLFSLIFTLDAIQKSHYQRSHLTTSINQSEQAAKWFWLHSEEVLMSRISDWGWKKEKENNTGGETVSFGCRPVSENLTSLAQVGRETNKVLCSEKLLSKLLSVLNWRRNNSSILNDDEAYKQQQTAVFNKTRWLVYLYISKQILNERLLGQCRTDCVCRLSYANKTD